MDPVQKLWMFEHWLKDQQDDVDLAKDQAYVIGSFIDPEAVRKLIDDSNKYESSEEEVEQSMEYIKNFKLPNKEQNKEPTKRRRRTIT
jgi:uncharacterized membrane protein